MKFEQAAAELERIVRALENDDLELEQAMDEFEKGIGLITKCRELLDKAEQRVEYLLKKEENTNEK